MVGQDVRGAHLDADDAIEALGWRRAAAEVAHETAPLRRKVEDTGACVTCTRQRGADWKQLLRLHTKLQTTASVANTNILPESWTADFFSGAPGGGVGLMMGPPARWQLGRKSAACKCCPGGEHVSEPLSLEQFS